MAPAIVAEDLRKRYGDVTALDKVSLSVGTGEVFALVGPNGAGKTTLVRALTGTAIPDEGRVSVLGTAPGDVDRARLGLLPQAFGPPERLTARELMAYYAGLYDEARDPDDVLAAVGLADAGDTWYRDLSGGEGRRVCVGAALVNDPDVLFLDEPTTGIDPAGRRALWSAIEDLAAGGTTVFLTTHYMAEVERLADRVGLLADGRLVEVGPPADLVAAHGGESRLLVETDAAAGPLSGLDYDVRAEGTELVIEGVAPADIGDVIAAFEERGIGYEALTWRQPDLEDVFLRLTEGSPDRAATDPEAAVAEGNR